MSKEKYQIILETVWECLFEGTQEECEKVLWAFQKYNGAKNISMWTKKEAEEGCE